MNATYSHNSLVRYIANALDTGAKQNELAREVAAYLMQSNKVGDLESVMRDAQDLRAREYGNVELTARSAHPITAEQRTQIDRLAKKQYPSAKKVTIDAIEDDSVVGGINLAFPHTNLDVTVKTKLNQLREAIS